MTRRKSCMSRVVVALLALAVVQPAQVPTQEAAPAQRKLRVLELSGSPFERGLQHGKALKKEIAILLARWEQWLQKSYGTPSTTFVKRFLARTEFDKAVSPWTPNLLEEVKGISKGAGVDFDTMFAFQLIDEIWAQGKALSAEKCTAIGVDRDGDCPTMVAQNLDIPRWYHDYPTLLKIRYPDSKLQTFVLTLPGLIAANGMSNRRVAVCVNTLLQLQPSPVGLPVAFVVRGLLEQEDWKAAKAFLNKIRHASGQNYTLGGPDFAPALECSDDEVMRFLPFTDAKHCYHTNHPLANTDWASKYRRAIKRRGKEPREGLYYCQRFASLEKRLAKGKRIDIELIKATLSSKDHERGKICNGSTYACTIMILGDKPEFHIAPGRPDRTPFQIYRFKD